jgi:hypothetical protein
VLASKIREKITGREDTFLKTHTKKWGIHQLEDGRLEGLVVYISVSFIVHNVK